MNEYLADCPDCQHEKEEEKKFAQLRAKIERAKNDERIAMQELSNAQAEITRLRSELAIAVEGQLCGHALRFVVSSDAGTSYCQACEKANADKAGLRAAIKRKDAALVAAKEHYDHDTMPCDRCGDFDPCHESSRLFNLAVKLTDEALEVA